MEEQDYFHEIVALFENRQEKNNKKIDLRTTPTGICVYLITYIVNTIDRSQIHFVSDYNI